MNKNILLIGGGGHCKSVLDSLLETGLYDKIGIIDTREKIGTMILGIPCIGCDEDLQRLFSEGFTNAFVTAGSIGTPSLRIKLFYIISEIGFEIPNIIDPSAVISRHVKMGNGIFVGKNAVINVGSSIQNGVIVNSGALIEHDCVICEFVHIAPGSVLSGNVQIEKNTHIGSNSVIKQQVIIGSDSIVGIGSVVLKNIGSNLVAYGNPCRERGAK
jgi:sugar O-acyltransferase (sialic acid O-acetyltransferase NeuD family)